MRATKAEVDAVRVKATVVSVALQMIVGRLVEAGLMTRGDLVSLREAGLKLASDLGASTGSDELWASLMSETERWWAATEAHACDGPRAQGGREGHGAPGEKAGRG